MRELISLKENKKYMLLEILYSSYVPKKIQSLSKYIDASVRSTNTYIKEIREQVEAVGGTIIASNDGILMNIPTHIGIDHFQRTVIRHSTSFKLLELLFFKREYSSKELEKQLFISASSLSRLSAQLRELLLTYGITLSSNPFKIIGDEFLVRKFYTKYFLEAYSELEWPFDARHKAPIDKLVFSFTLEDDMKNEVINYHKVRTFVTVSLLREDLGFSIYHSSLFKDQNIANYLEKSHSTVIRWLKSQAMSIDFIKRYSKLFCFIHLYYSGVYLENKINHGIIMVQLTDIYRSLRYLENLFNLPESEHVHLVYKISELLHLNKHYNSKIALDNYLIFKPRDYSLIEIYKKSYPLFYEVAENEMIQLCSNRNLAADKRIIEEMMYYLISKWQHLPEYLYNKFSECHLLVYSHLNKQHAESLKSLLDSKLEKSLSIQVFDDPFINEQVLKGYSFDLLVTTSTLSINIDQPSFYMPIKANEVNLYPLKELIKKIKIQYKIKSNQQINKKILLH